MAAKLGRGESGITKKLWLRSQLNLSGTSTPAWSFRAPLTKEGGGFTLASSETEMAFNKAALCSTANSWRKKLAICHQKATLLLGEELILVLEEISRYHTAASTLVNFWSCLECPSSRESSLTARPTDAPPLCSKSCITSSCYLHFIL